MATALAWKVHIIVRHV